MRFSDLRIVDFTVPTLPSHRPDTLIASTVGGRAGRISAAAVAGAAVDAAAAAGRGC